MKRTAVILSVIGCAVFLTSAAQNNTATTGKPSPSPKTPAEQPWRDSFVENTTARGKAREVLQVHNKTPYVLYLYVKDVRVGWLKPNRVGTLRGLVPGHHNVYAHSQFGSAHWGPKTIFVPGTWVLSQ